MSGPPKAYTSGDATEETQHESTVADRGSLAPAAPSFRSARYRIEAEIGRGGMGAVLRGRDADLGRDVAIKILRDEYSSHPSVLMRFLEEARITGQLQHPGIIPVYELGTFENQRPFFAMKLVKGRTLAELLGERGDPSREIARFLSIFEQIAQTVAYSHSRGVIHRDLKPSNVMIGAFGEFQVMDWGLAKVLDRSGLDRVCDDDTVIVTKRREEGSPDLSSEGSALGTPAYMSPEQARGEVGLLDERTDVFSLGSILCELLTGRPAFTGSSGGVLLSQANRGDVADALARLEVSGQARDLVELAKGCLAPDPAARPSSASLVADAVMRHRLGVEQRLRASEIVRAEAQARAAEERKRRRWQAGLAASIVALLVMGGLGISFWSIEQRDASARLERRIEDVRREVERARTRAEYRAPWELAKAAARAATDDPMVESSDVLKPELARLSDEIAAGLEASARWEAVREELTSIRAEVRDQGYPATDQAYARAFRGLGVFDDRTGAFSFSSFTRFSNEARIELAGYLDHWADVRRSRGATGEGLKRLIDAAITLDDDPIRSRIRRLLPERDRPRLAAALDEIARKASPESLPAPTAALLAGLLDEVGRRDQAIDLLRGALIVHPEDVWINMALAEAFDDHGGVTREDAIRYYQSARVLRPTTAHLLAHRLEESGREGEAIEVFRDLMKRRPGDINSGVSLGRLLKHRGRGDDADRVLGAVIQTASDTLDVDPKDWVRLYSIGSALLAMGKSGEAVARLRAAADLNPDCTVILCNLGLALASDGRLDEAEAAHRRSILLDSRDSRPRLNLASLSRRKRKFVEAEAAYLEAARLAPEIAIVRREYGNFLMSQVRHSEAEAELRRWVAIAPSGDAHYSLGTSLLVQNRLAEAETAFRAAIRLRPEHAESYCNLGHALNRQGRFEAALVQYRIGHELGSKRKDWKYPSARWMTGCSTQLELSSDLDAIATGRRAPRDSRDSLEFGMLCFESGRPEAAVRIWTQALETNAYLAISRTSPLRYRIATAAALAASETRGDGSPAREEGLRAKLRRQALALLRSELDIWSSAALSGGPAAASARVALMLWKCDAFLVSVRDPSRLASLPDSERGEWRALWARVDRVVAEVDAREFGDPPMPEPE